MKQQTYRGWLYLFLPLFLVVLACGFGTDDGGDVVSIPRGAQPITVITNAGAADWLESAAAQFNALELENDDGDPVYALVNVVEAGDAVVGLSEGNFTASMWIPDTKVWANVAADQGNANFQQDCVSIAQSPLVIGMWREAAINLGWPGRDLGWLDIGSLAADPTAWSYYSGGQFGETLRMGHTHPGLSASGASTLLAIVQAAESKTTAVTTDDIEQPIVQASVGAFEGAVSWFSKDTDTLGATMAERGTDFLGAAVMYENTVLHEGSGNIVPIYPFEGTFVAEHPACVNSGLDSAESSAATTFRNWLIETDAQNLAVSFGLRPVNTSADEFLLLSDNNGVNLSEPVNVFASPTVETVYAVQELWQSARKPVHVAMVIDTSGSMRGDKIDSMRVAAGQFVSQMGDDDVITLIEFATQPYILTENLRIGDNRSAVLNEINNFVAGGDTSLFDGIGYGALKLSEFQSPRFTNAIVVLTDGQDTSSRDFWYDDRLFQTIADSDATVFTIAYGRDAEDDLLENIAIQANGTFFLGDEANIGAIYEEMSAAFGGSAGVGR